MVGKQLERYDTEVQKVAMKAWNADGEHKQSVFEDAFKEARVDPTLLVYLTPPRVELDKAQGQGSRGAKGDRAVSQQGGKPGGNQSHIEIDFPLGNTRCFPRGNPGGFANPGFHQVEHLGEVGFDMRLVSL